MTAARNSARTNTPTEQNKEDNGLILYRLAAVEVAVNNLSSRFDKLDNISKSDLKEFQLSMKELMSEYTVSLQRQIDDKADKAQVDDLRTLVKAVGGFLSTVIGALVIYYITNKR